MERRRARPHARLALAALAGAAAAAPAARAHGAGGTGGTVEAAALPAWTLWAAGAFVVVLSFALLALFLTRDREPTPVEETTVTPGDVTGLPRGLVGALRLGGLLALALVVAATLVPWDPGPGARRLVWIGLWAALPIATYLVGNVWALASPFRALAGFADRLRSGRAPFAYPERLGAWPSVALLLAVVALELAEPSSPWLARGAIVYTTGTVVGMATFGSRTWLARAEAFDRAFAWWALAAPGRLTADGWRWGAPGGALVRSRADGAADAAFLVALLYAAKAESVLATGPGRALVDRLATLGPAAEPVAALAGLALFAAIFAAAVALVRAATRTVDPWPLVAGRLAVTLVPIAVGYHLAHNLPYLIDNLPLLLEAVADPLTQVAGAAPVGLAGFGRGVTVAQIALVLAGHVAGVYAGHRRLLTSFPSKVQAVKAELALTAAMAAYTLVSLWSVHAAAGGMA